MHEVKLEEAREHLVDLIDAALKGEDVVILSDDKQMVRLVPVKTRKRHPQFGSAKGQIDIAEDFDAPLDDFHEYVS